MQFRDVADVLWQEIVVSIEGMEREQDLKNRLLNAVEEVRLEAEGRPSLIRIRLEGRGVLHNRLLQPEVAEEWLEELREWAGQPAETEAWIWPESIVVRTGGLLKLEAAAEEDGFMGELLRRGMAAANNPEASKALLNEAMDALRRQPQIREWLDKKSHEERAQWIHLAMEMSVSLLQDEDAG
jgi:hypothetical protein